jgi:hypothetical protein
LPEMRVRTPSMMRGIKLTDNDVELGSGSRCVRCVLGNAYDGIVHVIRIRAKPSPASVKR